MAHKRWLAPWKNHQKRPTIYHLINRVVDRRFVLGDEEKEKFRMFMRMAENFTGCRVLSYCVMSNHFHLLLEVPPRLAAVGDCVLPYDAESADEPLPSRAVAAELKRSVSGANERAGAVGANSGAGVDGSGVVRGGLGVPGVVIEEEEFFRRLRELYSEVVVEAVRGELAVARKAGHLEEVARIFARYCYRMHDLSEYMKALTQRFSSWFNRSRDRKGRLWEQRFKSVIVEDGMAAKMMAAYIDLNPVRAGILADPADYRWSSYGEAMAGGRKARAGLSKVMGGKGESFSFEKFEVKKLLRAWGQGGRGKAYRVMLLGKGQEKKLEARVVRKGMAPEQAQAELARLEAGGSEQSIAKLIRHRIRYFSDGVVIGGKDFVEEVFEESRSRFGPKRVSGARKPRGALAELKEEVWTMRDLQRE